MQVSRNNQNTSLLLPKLHQALERLTRFSD
jgi:hypothetical protein